MNFLIFKKKNSIFLIILLCVSQNVSIFFSIFQAPLSAGYIAEL